MQTIGNMFTTGYAQAPTYTFSNPIGVPMNRYMKAIQAITQVGKSPTTTTMYMGMTESEVREHIASQGTKDYPAPTVVALTEVVTYF